MREKPLTATAYVLKQSSHFRDQHKRPGKDCEYDALTMTVRERPALRHALAEDDVIRRGVKRSRRMMARQSQWLTRYQTQSTTVAEAEARQLNWNQCCILPNSKHTRRVQNPLLQAPPRSLKAHPAKNFTMLVGGSFDDMQNKYQTEQVGVEMEALSKTVHRAIVQRPERFATAVYEMQNAAVLSGQNHLQPVTRFYEALCAAAADNPSRWEVTKQQFMQSATRTGGMRKHTAAQLFLCLDPYDTMRVRLMQAIVPIFLAYRPELHEFEAILQCTRHDIALNHLQHLYRMYAGVRGGMVLEDLKEILSCCLISETQRDDICEVMRTLAAAQRPSRNAILQMIPGFESTLLDEEHLMDLMKQHPEALAVTSALMKSFINATSNHVAQLRRDAQNSNSRLARNSKR